MSARSPLACVDAVRTEVTRMADAVRGVDPETTVPTCPEWTVADLVKHTGTVHRWAGQMVRDLATERLDPSTIDLGLPDDPRGYADWLVAGADLLVGAFTAVDPDAPMWSWGADQHARFWPRRMLHETTVHRVDADIAVGADPIVDHAVAADAIDELLENLPTAGYFRPRVTELIGSGESIALRGTDPRERWLIVLQPGGWDWGRRDGEATVTASGAVDSLMLLIYGRRAGRDSRLAISGDEQVLEFWLERSVL